MESPSTISPFRVSHGGMARGPPRRFDNGSETRRKLCGLLLAAYASFIRIGHYEYGVDGCFDCLYVD